MTAINTQAEQLKQMLSLELVSVQQLNVLLNLEKEALIQSDQENLTNLSERKTTLLEAIERRHQECLDWVKHQLHLDGSPEQLNKWIKSTPDSHRQGLDSLWNELKQGLLQVQAANQVNGALLSRLIYKNQFMMSLLSGQSQDKPVYGDKGREVTTASHGTLGKA